MKEPQPLVELTATGRWLPERVLTNQDLERMVDTSNDWIVERTGIKERRIMEPGTTCAQMGADAALIAMERAGVSAGEVDLIVTATATPDRLLPSTACDIQAILGASNAAAYDVAAACCGFIYGLSVAEGYLATGRGDVALVISTEAMSSMVDWDDRTTCVLFGDGAGAAVVKRSSGQRGILSSFLRSDGNLAELLWRPAGGVRMPMSQPALDKKLHLLHMAGREVFKAAVRSMAEAADQALIRAGMTSADVDLLIPHQANIRIVESTAKYAGIPMERVLVNVDRYGNMSSATVPIALDEALESGRIGDGANVLLVAFGAGFTWASMVIRC